MSDFAADFVYYLVYGLCVGAVYALIALGYTLVYGIIKLINFAYGEFYMAAAYAGFGAFVCLFPAETASPWLAVPVVLVVAGAAGGAVAVVAERVAYKPIRRAGRLAALLTALGLSFFLQNLFVLVNRGEPMSYRGRLGAWVQTTVDEAVVARFADVLPGPAAFLHASLGHIKLINLAYLPIVGLLTWALWLVVHRTGFGRAMRAVSQDPEAAALMGVDIDRVVRGAFLLGGVLAGVAGALNGLQFGVSPFMGFQPGIKAFIAAVVGGIGSIPGAVVGGLTIGLTENLVLLTGIDSGYKDVACYVVLTLVLLARPQGLLGRPESEKI